jgi:hypothetical protein
MSVDSHPRITKLSYMFMSDNLWFFLFEKKSDLTLADFFMKRENLIDLNLVR